MSNLPLLEGKHAVVFGAAGSVGTAVAKEFAAQGAEVFLSGRNRAGVEKITNEITTAGGRAHASVIDALDDAAVNNYIKEIVAQAGSIDAVFNAMGPLVTEYANGRPAVDVSVEEFVLPVNTVLKSQFITARAAARQMLDQRRGVIIFLTGGPARAHVPGTTAIGAAFGAVEALTRNLALELGPSGVRVVCLRTAGMPDSRTIQDTADTMVRATNMTREQVRGRLADLTMLKMSPSVCDTAKVAALLASDDARMLTGTVLNASAGAVAD